MEDSGRELLVDNARLNLINGALRHLNEEGSRHIGSGKVETFYTDLIKQFSELVRSQFAVFVSYHLKEGVRLFIDTGAKNFRIDMEQLMGEQGLFKFLLDIGKSKKITNVATYCAQHQLSCGGLKIHNLLSIPIMIDEGLLVGVFLADKMDQKAFDESDETTLGILVKDVAYFMQRQEFLSAMKRSNIALQKEKEEQQQLIYKLKEAKEQLLQSEKMASIGQLAAGVAHEINNPVGYISSNLCTLADYLSDIFNLLQHYANLEACIDRSSQGLSQLLAIKNEIDVDFLKQDIIDLVTESEEGAERVRRIVQDLKDFSHEGEDVWEYSDLHAGLNSTLNIVNNEIKYKAHIIKEFGEIPMIECIASQLNQVFLNFLVNAAHSIETKGTITIRTSTAEELVCVEMEDTGKGISEEYITKIFDPFFTTKPIGEGTGLGLSLSYGIINKHGGRIEVVSEEQKGTKFSIYLPIHQKARHDTYVV